MKDRSLLDLSALINDVVITSEVSIYTEGTTICSSLIGSERVNWQLI